MSHSGSMRRLLLPLAPAFRLALAARELRLRLGLERVRQLRWPVISIGSLSAGGAGKTPLTIALAKLLAARGLQVDILSRGYGRLGRHAARVRPELTAEEFGDEPLLIARATALPVYVASRRYDAGLLAEAEAPPQGDATAPSRVHLLDDGFQHRRLARDVDILLVNQFDWNDSLLPAGNLREPRTAIRRASVIAIPADEPELRTELTRWGWTGPVWRLRRRMEAPATEGPVAAFCGIARPEQFFRGLESAGMRLAAHTAFPDHHRFTIRDFERLLDSARASGATALVTTEKDQVRFEPVMAICPASLPLLTARLRVEIADEADAVQWLERRLK